MVTTRLASDEPKILRSDTIGDAWFTVAGLIVASGVPSRYDNRPIREISLVTLAVARPDPDDEIIAQLTKSRQQHRGPYFRSCYRLGSGL